MGQLRGLTCLRRSRAGLVRGARITRCYNHIIAHWFSFLPWSVQSTPCHVQEGSWSVSFKFRRFLHLKFCSLEVWADETAVMFVSARCREHSEQRSVVGSCSELGTLGRYHSHQKQKERSCGELHALEIKRTGARHLFVGSVTIFLF